MAKAKQQQYGNESISMLKDEERVRKRPAVIFGSDDLEGCKHAVFEILSNAIDEAREGHGDLIIVTRYEDLSGIAVGDSVEQVQEVHPDGLYMYTDSLQQFATSAHYTGDGFLVTIKYENDLITEITTELI